jgi:preprotein translocase SecE subunit
MMFTFFYDSLATLKKVKAPTWAEILKMAGAVLIVIAIASVLFAFTDGVFAELYKMLYHGMTGK